MAKPDDHGRDGRGAKDAGGFSEVRHGGPRRGPSDDRTPASARGRGQERGGVGQDPRRGVDGSKRTARDGQAAPSRGRSVGSPAQGLSTGGQSSSGRVSGSSDAGQARQGARGTTGARGTSPRRPAEGGASGRGNSLDAGGKTAAQGGRPAEQPGPRQGGRPDPVTRRSTSAPPDAGRGSSRPDARGKASPRRDDRDVAPRRPPLTPVSGAGDVGGQRGKAAAAVPAAGRTVLGDGTPVARTSYQERQQRRSSGTPDRRPAPAPRGPASRSEIEERPYDPRREARRQLTRVPLPDDVDPRDLDQEARRQLTTLSKDTADLVAQHLVMAGRLMDEDPTTALAHARAARAMGGRVGVVREANGLVAYAAGEWAEALSELRTARRITGQPDHLPVMADCERALGRPDRALMVVDDPQASSLDPAGRVELLIVSAGARRDMGQVNAAIISLQVGALEGAVRPWTSRLRYAYADALLEAGRTAEARTWFSRTAEADPSGETDAVERLLELDGYALPDVEDELDDDDAQADARSAGRTLAAALDSWAERDAAAAQTAGGSHSQPPSPALYEPTDSADGDPGLAEDRVPMEPLDAGREQAGGLGSGAAGAGGSDGSLPADSDPVVVVPAVDVSAVDVSNAGVPRSSASTMAGLAEQDGSDRLGGVDAERAASRPSIEPAPWSPGGGPMFRGEPAPADDEAELEDGSPRRTQIPVVQFTPGPDESELRLFE